mmetsp:Transcript_12865/g.19007  ORF Transcript_12865/g.19007 Transcript_12865/m.19007 type:complete len:86 (-) Transcript_12865:423-680(-)|eukprot:CAMPEP_0194040256 /NCGR_PEP_ID=MMETSP0009_2-20130614/12293_1 /TAXON_ID=210454 /ORGANISM="Grammatophora oceanica, Strain CCMP 410" /LENGTH=85 /DNA_ID=CAMNT_0038683347 /DNA_START=1099 /DNA_END=1356 /DNA_ORIENTATION=+
MTHAFVRKVGMLCLKVNETDILEGGAVGRFVAIVGSSDRTVENQWVKFCNPWRLQGSSCISLGFANHELAPTRPHLTLYVCFDIL